MDTYMATIWRDYPYNGSTISIPQTYRGNFTSPEKALDWADNRPGTYYIEIEALNYSSAHDNICVMATNTNKGMIYRKYNYRSKGWEKIARWMVIKYFG